LCQSVLPFKDAEKWCKGIHQITNSNNMVINPRASELKLKNGEYFYRTLPSTGPGFDYFCSVGGRARAIRTAQGTAPLTMEVLKKLSLSKSIAFKKVVEKYSPGIKGKKNNRECL
jgi:hypothetical protein